MERKSGSIFTFQCMSSAKGKIIKKEESGPFGRSSYAYSYDNKGHLLEVRRNGTRVERYVYDSQGRRIEDYRSWRGGSRQFVYGFDGKLIRVNDAYIEWTEQGQLKAIYDKSERVEFEYGNDTRLDQVLLPSGICVQYEYDREALMPSRVLESREPVYEYVWKDRTRLIRCVDVRAGVAYNFFYGKGRTPQAVSLRGHAQALYQLTGVHAASGVKLRLWTDQIGSVRMLASEKGAVVKYLEFDAFGNVTQETKAHWHFPLGFACGLSDRYTGFVRFGYRDYDPQVGRFTAKDPIGYTGGDNDLWDYCVDDPVGNLDPSGLLHIDIDEDAAGTGAHRKPDDVRLLPDILGRHDDVSQQDTAAWLQKLPDRMDPVPAVNHKAFGTLEDTPDAEGEGSGPERRAAVLNEPRVSSTSPVIRTLDELDPFRRLFTEGTIPEALYASSRTVRQQQRGTKTPQKAQQAATSLQLRKEKPSGLITDDGYIDEAVKDFYLEGAEGKRFITTKGKVLMELSKKITGPGADLDRLASEIQMLPANHRAYLAYSLSDSRGQVSPQGHALALLLAGISKKRVAEALDQDVKFEEFRRSFAIDDLPYAMRRPTQVWVARADDFIVKNKKEIGMLAERYDRASSQSEREQVLEDTYKLMLPMFGLTSIQYLIRRERKEYQPFSAYGDADDKFIFLAVNPNSTFFTRSDKKAVYLEATAALLHEIVHAHQIYWSNIGSMYGKPMTHSFNNALARIPFDSRAINNKPYAAQPLEMQGHIIQYSIEKTLKNIFNR